MGKNRKRQISNVNHDTECEASAYHKKKLRKLNKNNFFFRIYQIPCIVRHCSISFH